jgi:hypothetical protein
MTDVPFHSFSIHLTKASDDLMTLLLMIDVTPEERAETLASVPNTTLYWEGDTRNEFDSVLDGLLTMLEVADAPVLEPDSE